MSACPYCGRANDAATAPLDSTAVPRSGDPSICFGCGELALFTGDGLDVRRPTNSERQAYLRDPEVIKIMLAWRQWKEQAEGG